MKELFIFLAIIVSFLFLFFRFLKFVLKARDAVGREEDNEQVWDIIKERWPGD